MWPVYCEGVKCLPGQDVQPVGESRVEPYVQIRVAQSENGGSSAEAVEISVYPGREIQIAAAETIPAHSEFRCDAKEIEIWCGIEIYSHFVELRFLREQIEQSRLVAVSLAGMPGCVVFDFTVNGDFAIVSGAVGSLSKGGRGDQDEDNK